MDVTGSDDALRCQGATARDRCVLSKVGTTIGPMWAAIRRKIPFWICSVTSEVRLQAVFESHLRNRVTRTGCSGFRFLRTHPRFEVFL